MKTTLLIKLVTGLAVALSAANSSRAANIIKADNADNLNLTTSWVGGVAPAATDVAVWDSTVTSGNTTLFGANASWLGLKIMNPGGPVQINAGSTLTLGASGIDMATASQNLSLSNAVTIGPRAQKWTVASGQSLNVLALPTKPHTGVDTAGTVEFSTTGTFILGGTTVGRILDSHNNPWATLGKNDWAALSAGQVVAAIYTDATTVLVGGVDNNIVADLTGANAIDTASIRFNDPTPRTLTVANSGTSRTCTARGVLVTENSGGATIGGNTTASFIRPNRTTSGAAGGGVSFHFIQNSLIGDLTLAARTADASSSTPVRLVKSGPGRMILAANAGNGHSAGTVVHEGTLQVNAGASLVTGAVLVNSGRLAVNTASTQNVASITISGSATNNLTIAQANGVFQSTTLILNTGAPRMEFSWNSGVAPSTTVAPLVVTNFTKNGTATIDIFSGNLSAGTFPLIKYTTLAGAGDVSLGFLPPRIAAHLTTNGVNSTIDLVVDSVTAPIFWATGSGTWDIATSLNWKDAVTATTSYQEFATPYGSFGDSVQFEDSLSAASPITVTLDATVKPASVLAANSAKAYSITGFGSIAGSGSLTKSGAGTLTLATANTFTGPVNLNGGTVVISSLTGLGAGTAINFGGGTLQYSGNSDDISARTVTFNSGGATINDGGNFVNFVGPVGNSGLGGLTKTGAGTLMLNGTNRYAGNTLISEGTLTLGFNSYISNSPAIILSGGATFDVTGNGLITLASSIGQKLAGVGAVSGGVTVPASTTLTPATNGAIGTFTINGDLTFSGGAFAADVTPTTRDLIVVNGSLVLTSGELQLNVSGPLANGSYPLIQYAGSLIGAVGDLLVSGYSPVGKSVTLSDTTPGQINLLIADSASDVLTWSGSASADWDTLGSLNWLNGANPWAFTNGSFVTFDDSGAAQPFIQLQAAVAPGSVTVNNPTVNYTLADATGTGAGKISGAAAIVKSGAGMLTLNTINNNAGPLTINAGTVQVGDGGSNGALGTGNVTNNGALVFRQIDARQVSGLLAGSGSLEQAGSSTLTLAGATTYTGPTTVSSGTLQVGTGGAAGPLATATITNNGTVILNSSSSWSYGNGIRGTGNLIKSGSGTLTLSGVTAYDGNTSISNGVLRIVANETVPDGGTSTGWLIQDGSTVAAGTLDLNGFNETVNALAGLGSTVNGLITNSGTTGTNILTIGNNNGTDTESFARIAENAAGAKLAVVKNGSSAQTLAGANSYVGGTVVQEGTLRLRNNTAAGSGSIVLSNATTLSLNTAPGNNSIFPGNEVITPADATVTITANNVANGYNTPFTGSATSTNSVPVAISISANTTKQFQNFTGTVRIEAAGRIRFSSTSLSINGGDNTIFEVSGAINTRNGTGTAAGSGIALGALTGTGAVNGAGDADGNSTYLIGAKGLDTVFSGTISGTPPRGTSIVKVGAGNLTLDGGLSYVGSTTISNGLLTLGGAAELDDSPTINVRNGATLDVAAIGGVLNLGNLVGQSLNGAGTIRGSVVQNANSQIAPGDGVGILTVTNTVTLGGTNVMEINRTNAVTADRIVAQQGFIVSGTPYVVVQNVGTTNFTAGDKFTLFSQPVSGLTISGNLPALPCAGLTWINNLDVDGSLEVGGSPCVNLTPTNIISTVVGNALDLQWPADRTGWTLQTNAVSVANPSAWFAYPGSTATNRVIIPINPNAANVFFRLVYP
jgi:fibronectin-binding autotransporter adhesin